MRLTPTHDLRLEIDGIYRSDSRRIFATLVRIIGDFDLAEEAMQDAFASAMEQWPHDGVPENPYSWLVSAGRFKAIDAIRRRVRSDTTLAELAAHTDQQSEENTAADLEGIEDDRLRLVFTCCHPCFQQNRASR